MKITTLILLGAISTSFHTFASSQDDQRSAARIDEENLEVLDEHEREMRLKAAENPRNRSFPGSLKKVGEDYEMQKEEDLDDLEEFKNDPYLNTGDKDKRD
jgi:hypothetical protein